VRSAAALILLCSSVAGFCPARKSRAPFSLRAGAVIGRGYKVDERWPKRNFLREVRSRLGAMQEIVFLCRGVRNTGVLNQMADENLDRFRTPRGYQYYRRQFSAQILTFSFEILSALSQVFLGLDDFSFSLSYLALVLADFLFACPATNVFAQFCAIRFQLLPGIL